MSKKLFLTTFWLIFIFGFGLAQYSKSDSTVIIKRITTNLTKNFGSLYEKSTDRWLTAHAFEKGISFSIENGYLLLEGTVLTGYRKYRDEDEFLGKYAFKCSVPICDINFGYRSGDANKDFIVSFSDSIKITIGEMFVRHYYENEYRHYKDPQVIFTNSQPVIIEWTRENNLYSQMKKDFKFLQSNCVLRNLPDSENKRK
jgi:hypothetical protein